MVNESTNIRQKMGEPLSPCANQTTKLLDRFKLEKPDLSYVDLHSEVVKNADNMASSSGARSKQHIGSLAVESEEIVKHMSNLPSYLERGQNFQDKVLNFGVMDWGKLEKWQYAQKQVPCRIIKGSPSSNSSSFFSTDGSSTHSSRGHSYSPVHQNSHRPTLRSHFSTSPQHIVTPDDHLTEQTNTTRQYQAIHKTQMEIRLKECRRKDIDSQSIPKTGSFLDQARMASSLKGKMKMQEDESIKGPKKLENRYYGSYDRHYVEKHKTVVLLLPRDGPDRQTTDVEWVEEGSNLEEVHHLEHFNNTRRSCFESEVDLVKRSEIKTYYISTRSSSEPSTRPSSANVLVSPSRSKNSEQKKSTMPGKVTAIPSRTKNAEEKKSSMSEKVTARPSSTKNVEERNSALPSKDLEASKVRSLSPLRRLSIGISKIGRNSTSRDSTVMPQLSSELVTSNSGSDRVEVSAGSDNSIKVNPNVSSRARSSPLRRFSSSSRDTPAMPQLNHKFVSSKPCSDNAEASACSDNLANGNPNVSNKARSSPLRRLLEPLFPSKATNSYQSADTSHRELKVNLKAKLDLSCKEIGNDNSGRDKNNESKTMQALFQMAVKNGRPLFTFAVENNSDVLAATVRKLSSSMKDGSEWIYTFFTVQEVKKKNTSWLNSSSKAKGHGYVPNIVAQMKVSDPSTSNREFVLFSVDLKQLDQQVLNVNPRDELAAIIVKLPRKAIKDDSVDHFSTTVILPGGHHGLPSEGEPSTLIERWRSGGLCDCGGWDIGCRMRTLASQTQTSAKASATQVHLSANEFKLFSQQGEFPVERPFFSMSPLKECIYSVEFNSSLTILQAFSTCISVLDCRKSSQLSESSNFYEEKSEETSELKQEELPVRYASYPPLSPVGRV